MKNAAFGRNRDFAAYLLTVAAVILVFGLSACDEGVDPFIEADRFHTLYGYLDTASDTQYVRVIPLRREIGGTGDPEIDATVTSTALESGQVIVWRDSVVQMSDESIAHVFYAPFRPIPGWTYEIEVRRSDGIVTSAETTLPLAENATVVEPQFSGAGANQRVVWEGIDFPPFRVEVWYRFANTLPNQPFREAVVVYNDFDIGAPAGGDTWEVVARLSRDKAAVARILGVSEDARLPLLGVGMRLAIKDERWRPPGGVFDREVLVQPGTFSNVQNGFGFIGSVNQYTVEWALEEEVLTRLGYGIP